jgi:nicotinate dehydrogenase subunit B
MSARQVANPARRRVLAAGGALVVTFALRPLLAAPAGSESQNKGAQPKAAPELPGSLKTQPLLDGWIRIDADGSITVFTGKAELGQGIKTALIQVAAEELVVNPARITLVTADTERTPNEGYTAGSHSMQDSGTAIRHAAAQVRAILLGLAAKRFAVPVERLRVDNGMVLADGNRRVSYGELVSGRELLHVIAAPESPLRDPKDHTVMGKPLPRVDIPAKVTGGAAYVQDLRLPGMVHARVVRPPGPGAMLVRLDTAGAEKLPGVLKIVRDGRFIGVIAEREYQAITASRMLVAAAQWEERPTLPAQADLYKSLQSAPSQDFVILERGALAGSGARTLAATYRRPYQMHASIGPSCAIAQLADDKYTVWTHSQGVYPLRDALAEMLRVPKERVHCIHAEGSGCYGHNAADDVAADAALLARALPGRPVRVQWMREDEHGWEPFGPPMISGAQATIDASGNISEWQYEVWSNTHSTRPGAAGNLLAATHLEQPFAPPPPKPLPQPEGGGDRNAIPLYTLPNARVVHHFLPDMPLRVSALRSLGAYCNVFAIESFMDELAVAAKADPVAFRLRHMSDARAHEVIRVAAERFGWGAYQRQPRRGRGFAFARYKNLAGFAAMAIEVEVARDSGLIRIIRAVAAVDSGEAVNPDGIRNQIEGGIIQSSSWTLAEEIMFDKTRVTSRDWAGYPILRFPQVPDRIEVHIVDRPGQPFLGMGEVAQGPTSAAIANAVADATGVRFRDLPLSRRRVRAALEA